MSKYLDFIGQQISQVKTQKVGSTNNAAFIRSKISEGWPYVLGTLAFTGVTSFLYNKVKNKKESENNQNLTYPLEISEGEFFDQEATRPYVFSNPEPMERQFDFDEKTEVMERTGITEKYDNTLDMPAQDLLPKDLFSQQYEDTDSFDKNPPIDLFQDSPVSNVQDTLELQPRSGAANAEFFEYQENSDETSKLAQQMGLSDFMGDEMQNYLNTTGGSTNEKVEIEEVFNQDSVKDQLSSNSKSISDAVGGDLSAFGNLNDFSKFAEDQGPATF